MLRDCLKARGRVGSRQDGICGAIAFLHQVEDLLLDAQRLLGRHHLAVTVRGMGSSHHDLPILDELIDPALDAFDGDAFETEIERSLRHHMKRPGRLAFGQDADGRRDRELRARLFG